PSPPLERGLRPVAREALTPGIIAARKPRLRASNEASQLDAAGLVEPFPDVEIGRHLPGVSTMHSRRVGIRERQAAVVAHEPSAPCTLTPRDLPHNPRVRADLHFGVAAPEPVGAGPSLVLQDRPAPGE